ncbi:MAG: sigma-54-dependent Fis family transcriptional regulator, partial [Alphaproteobacteria bacterium]
EATVLITGSSGTGKEVMSRYIHAHSKRKTKKFISLNCAAIPENLLESELFGHEKGAFTGAVARRIGKFEEADGGTLLLDEVSEMHPSLQAKLLRAVQERVIDRVGGKEPVKVDIRLIATSNRDLAEEVKNGNFREDLYFRLNVINLQLPDLKDRPSDILPLAKLFVEKYTEENGLPVVKKLSQAAVEKMQSYHWPGNVRELENTLHRAVLISGEDEIEPAAIILSEAPQQAVATEKPAASAPAPQDDDGVENAMAALVGHSMADMEKEMILRTLDHCLGNRTHAARILGISIRTLRNKLNQYDLDNKSASG